MDDVKKRLIDLLESKRANCSRGIQLTLREIDTRTLARIMSEIDEKYHEIFFRNISRKANEILVREIALQKKRVERKQVNWELPDRDKEFELLVQLLEQFTDEDQDELQTFPVYPENALDLSSAISIVETIGAMAVFTEENGLLALDSLIERTDNSFFKKALEMVVGGTDPLLTKDILENYMRQYVKQYENTLIMIMTGILSLQMGDLPEFVKEQMLSIDER